MKKKKLINLEGYEIENVKEIFYNLSYEELYKHETKKRAEDDLEKAIVTVSGALAVDTGRFTGRSPKDKYIVGGGPSSENIWWAGEEAKGSDNKPVSIETWHHLLEIVTDGLEGRNLYITDAYAGANSKNRIGVRLITDVAWQAHFFKNMFIDFEDGDEVGFEPDWTILSAPRATCRNFEEHGLNSEVFIVINIEKRMILIGGTWYAGEIKKGIFSVMNYLLPLKGIGSFHCSANIGKDNDSALFFGLSGTGKTTLSTDPERKLIGDDEHGWDEEGVFNYEGGCYAKVINLSEEYEPDIYKAIRKNALLENVVVNSRGEVDFSSNQKTENTRASYPLSHINNALLPVSSGPHPKTVIFLTCDSFGVLPPVAKLTIPQAEYWFLSGYTAKIAGTERGLDEPQATFSPCFGAPFLLLHPTVYAQILGKKLREHGSEVYLVNTGWTGGGYGVGERFKISLTRSIVREILNGSLGKRKYDTLPVFNLDIPKKVNGVGAEILNPRNTWADKDEYDRVAKRLAEMFIENFKTFTDTKEGYDLVSSGPDMRN